METEYWLIVYTWKSGRNEVVANDVWDGSIADWMLKALEQPESWRLVNAIQLDYHGYEKLFGNVG